SEVWVSTVRESKVASARIEGVEDWKGAGEWVSTVAVMRLVLGGIGAGEGGMCWARTTPPPLSWLGAPPRLGKPLHTKPMACARGSLFLAVLCQTLCRSPSTASRGVKVRIYNKPQT